MARLREEEAEANRRTRRDALIGCAGIIFIFLLVIYTIAALTDSPPNGASGRAPAVESAEPSEGYPRAPGVREKIRKMQRRKAAKGMDDSAGQAGDEWNEHRDELVDE